jgi:peptidoglycan/LPS O-acetylase OafA/YrhL
LRYEILPVILFNIYFMPVNNSTNGYLPNLDVLRFFLALFVLIFHVPEISKNAGLSYYNEMPFFHRGHEAVYWFFVLSGFLLSLIAHKEIRIKRFSILRFMIRRVLRIWPVYFLVSFVGLLFYYVVLPLLDIPFQNNADFSTAFLLQFFFLSNVLHAFYDPGGILTITWSVSVEEQFYLIFPILVFFCYRVELLRRIVIAFLFLLVCIVYLFFPSIGELMQQLGMYVELFLIGIIAAEFFNTTAGLNHRVKNVLLVFSVALFLMLFCTDWLLIPDYPFLWRLVNGVSAAFVVLALAGWHKNCYTKLFMLGGKISYGIYMYHMIVITGLIFVFQQLPFQGYGVVLLINLLSIVITYLLAWFSFRFYESRFLKMKKY